VRGFGERPRGGESRAAILGAPQDTWIRLEGSIVFDLKLMPHP
jgi:hypothetical protein